jgi:hypothetical protein
MYTQVVTSKVLNFYTDKIRKVAVSVVIQTTNGFISGDVYTRPMNRVIDELSLSDQFLAVTDAVVYDDSKNVRFRAKFLTINREHIVYVIPRDDLIVKGNSGSGSSLLSTLNQPSE